MMRKLLFIGIGAYAFLMYLSSCGDKAKPLPTATIVSIEDYKTQMEEVEGYEDFEANCVTCHSLRYIEMQPDFPRKTWDAIVHKMIKNFGSGVTNMDRISILVNGSNSFASESGFSFALSTPFGFRYAFFIQ